MVQKSSFGVNMCAAELFISSVSLKASVYMFQNILVPIKMSMLIGTPEGKAEKCLLFSASFDNGLAMVQTATRVSLISSAFLVEDVRI